MLTPTKILLATNGTEEASAAENMAAEIACNTDAELHLVYVVARLTTPPTTPAVAHLYSESRLESRRMDALRFIDERTRNLEAATKMEVRSHYREGKVEAQVLGLAEEISADLIVCGEKRRTWLERAFGMGLPRHIKRHSDRRLITVGQRVA